MVAGRDLQFNAERADAGACSGIRRDCKRHIRAKGMRLSDSRAREASKCWAAQRVWAIFAA